MKCEGNRRDGSIRSHETALIVTQALLHGEDVAMIMASSQLRGQHGSQEAI